MKRFLENTRMKTMSRAFIAAEQVQDLTEYTLLPASLSVSAAVFKASGAPPTS
jgi:hypothetical protein